MTARERKKVQNVNTPTLQDSPNLVNVLLYGTVLGFYIFSLIAHKIKLTTNPIPASVNDDPKFEPLKAVKLFKYFYFTAWNFGLQIIFLILAVVDETSKLVNFSAIQRRIEKARLFLFSTLVFPSSLLVMSIFWSIWHIDRELIFPRALDDFYPAWLNHTLHTLIAIPLIIEVLVQLNNKNYRVSRRSSAIILITYCTIYQALYMSVYFNHGIWLYPIYKVLTWTQRIAFVLGQLLMILSYQQIGISFLAKNKEVLKTKRR